jgi:LacI family transcriptional regulator
VPEVPEVPETRPAASPAPATGPAARITIADVAREAGVRPSTVSKALNGGRGSPEVRRRVEEAAARLDYRPSQRAQALRTSRSRSIGVVVPDLVNPGYLSLLRGVENVAHEQGYVVIVADGQRSPDAQSAALERFFEHGVDGLVLGGPVPPEALRLHLHHGVPVVPAASDDERALARLGEEGEAAATRDMGRRLLELGHRRFGFVSTPPLPGGGRFRRGRLTALHTVLEEAGAELTVSLVDPDRDPDGCRRALGGLLAGDRAPTALVCANQLVAPWLLMAVRDAGRRLPDDVSLVVHGDSDWARAYPPPLSVVARDAYAEGQSLAASLLDALAGVDAPRRPAPEARYVERGSCAPPPG